MKKLILLLTLFIALAAGCGNPPPAGKQATEQRAEVLIVRGTINGRTMNTGDIHEWLIAKYGRPTGGDDLLYVYQINGENWKTLGDLGVHPNVVILIREDQPSPPAGQELGAESEDTAPNK